MERPVAAELHVPTLSAGLVLNWTELRGCHTATSYTKATSMGRIKQGEVICCIHRLNASGDGCLYLMIMYLLSNVAYGTLQSCLQQCVEAAAHCRS